MVTKELLQRWVEKAIAEGNDPRKIFDDPEEVESYLLSCGVAKEECYAMRICLRSLKLKELIAVQPKKISYVLFQNCQQSIFSMFPEVTPIEIKKAVTDITESLGGNIEPKINIPNIIKFGKYDWKVLDYVPDKGVLIITKDVTHIKIPYNKKYVDCTWETCTLRHWLNNKFFNTFSLRERALISLSTIINEDNQWFGIEGGNTTEDRIFLLSISEVVKYFGDSGQLENKNPNSKYNIDDQYNEARSADYADYKENGDWWWWLRSPGYSPHNASEVNLLGKVNVYGKSVNFKSNDTGIRPAMWIKLPQ